MQTTTSSISQQYQDLKAKQPHLRHRDAAKNLGISEAELLLELQLAKPLTITTPELLKALPHFGKVMSLTRNEGCVLEHTGVFESVEVINDQVATVIGPIETRAFLAAWKNILVVEFPKGNSVLKSIQVFDQFGNAVTKIFLKTEDEPEIYAQWKANSISMDAISFTEKNAVTQPKEISQDFDLAGFLTAWSLMKDPHDFFGMLSKFKVTRLQAMQITKGVFTSSFDHNKLPALLSNLANNGTPIMIFAGNTGNVQIHQDLIFKVIPMQRDPGVFWLNIMDPEFNMHLRMDLISEAYLVTKPSESGPVVSIECYDAAGELIVQFFGIRKPGVSQDPNWIRALQLVIEI